MHTSRSRTHGAPHRRRMIGSLLGLLTVFATIAGAQTGGRASDGLTRSRMPAAWLSPQVPLLAAGRTPRIPSLLAQAVEPAAAEQTDSGEAAGQAAARAEQKRRARSAVVLLSIVVGIALSGLLLIIVAIAVRGIQRKFAGPVRADIDPTAILPELTRGPVPPNRPAAVPDPDDDAASQETVHT